MKRRIWTWLDPILVIGVLVSVAIGLVSFFQLGDKASGFLIGLTSTTITLIIDLIAKTHRMERNILESTGLLKVISEHSLDEAVKDIAKSYEAISGYEYDVFTEAANSALSSARSRLAEIANGTMKIIVQTSQMVRELGYREFERANKSAMTIHIGAMDYWTSDFGKRYFRVNQHAIRRGVKVTRIFALSDDEARRHIDILKEHSRHGVNVIILAPNFVDKEYMIFDERIMIYYDKDQQGNYQAEYVVLNPQRVRDSVADFNNLAKHPRSKGIKDYT